MMTGHKGVCLSVCLRAWPSHTTLAVKGLPHLVAWSWTDLKWRRFLPLLRNCRCDWKKEEERARIRPSSGPVHWSQSQMAPNPGRWGLQKKKKDWEGEKIVYYGLLCTLSRPDCRTEYLYTHLRRRASLYHLLAFELPGREPQTRINKKQNRGDIKTPMSDVDNRQSLKASPAPITRNADIHLYFWTVIQKMRTWG